DGPADGSAEAPASAEGVGDHLGGVGDQGVLPLGVLVVPAGQDGDDDRLGVACGPQHRDVVAGAVVAAAGLVADLPVVRDAGPDQVVTGGVALQQVGEEGALLLGQRVAQGVFAQVGGERAGGAGVPLVAGDGLVQLGLVAVHAGGLIADPAEPGLHPLRPVELVEQQVGGGVVAVADRGVADLAQRHAGVDVLLGDGGVLHQVVLGVGDHRVAPG